jgi:hypothetical protein
MALAIHSSTPGPKTVSNVGTTTVSAAFSPPANSAIYVFFSLAGGTTAQSITNMTDSLGSHLEWNLYPGSRDNLLSGSTIRGSTEVWYSYTGSAQTNMTVTATYATANNNPAGTPAGLMQIVVFTGASTATGNATIRNDSATAVPSQTIVTSASNSWVFGTISNWTNSTGPTVGSNQTTIIDGTDSLLTNASDGDAFWVQLQNAPTPTSGTTVTIDDSAPSIVHHFSIVEIMAAPVAPSVTTTPVTNVGPTTATGNGSVDDDGGGTITERGVCWNTSANPTTANSKATSAGTTGSYSVSITGLSDNTLYHARAYAINSAGTSYGADVTFQDYPVSTGWLRA